MSRPEVTLTFSDTDYVGEVKDGKRHGHGMETGPYVVVEGTWENDERHGQFTETMPSGIVATGVYKRGKRDGEWTTTFSDGGVVKCVHAMKTAAERGAKSIGAKIGNM